MGGSRYFSRESARAVFFSLTAALASVPATGTIEEALAGDAHAATQVEGPSINPRGWTVPDISAATRVGSAEDKHNPGIMLDFYQFGNGDRVIRRSRDQTAFAFDVMSQANGRYSFVSPNCDGVYTHRYPAGLDVPIPKCGS